jgi:hypothetical protein
VDGGTLGLVKRLEQPGHLFHFQCPAVGLSQMVASVQALTSSGTRRSNPV